MRKFYVRTNKYDGKAPSYDLMHAGVKLGEISFLELMELLAQIAVVAADRERK
jgi:hexokinase